MCDRQTNGQTDGRLYDRQDALQHYMVSRVNLFSVTFLFPLAPNSGNAAGIGYFIWALLL